MKMKIENMPLSQLLKMAHQKNPKDHDIDSLRASFRRFGFTAPPTIDEVTQTMVAGHGRCEALELIRTAGEPPPDGIVEKGTEWLVPVVRGVSFKSETERDAYVIADNQNVMAGGWKFDVLADLMKSLDGNGGFEGLGFQEIELNALLQRGAPEEPDGGMDPEATDGNDPGDGDGKKKPRVEMKVTVECPECGHKFER